MSITQDFFAEERRALLRSRQPLSLVARQCRARVRRFFGEHSCELTAAALFLALASSEFVLLVKYLDLLRRVGS